MPFRTMIRPGALASLCLLGWMADSSAKPQHWGTHVVLREPDAVTTLHDAIGAAWARLPERDVYAAQQNVEGARDISGAALFPDAPTASASHVNDKVAGSNLNYITTEVGVSTPIWLPGEGTATQDAARAEGVAIEAQTAVAHLALARQILGLASDAANARNAYEIAARRLATNRALAADLAHRFAVGESSQSDALAADAEANNAELGLAQAEAQLGVARVAIAVLTGSEAIPLLAVPIGAAPAWSASGHPQVVAAARRMEAARAQARLVYLQNRDDPEIGVEGIDEKQPGTRWDTRFGVTLKFHFATEARNAPRRAVALEALTKATVQLELARREVEARVAQARVEVAASEHASAAADRATIALEKRRGQIERAWRVGEMPLIELVRANALAFDAAAAGSRARNGRAVAAWQLQLCEGALP